MNSLKCTHCGLVYLVRDAAFACPRCGTNNEPAPAPPEERRGAWGALAALVCALLVVAAGVFFYLRPEPEAAYVGAIRSSEQFKQLATVRVNRSPLGPPDGRTELRSLSDGTGDSVRGVTPAAFVLEARGLLSFTDETTETRMPREKLELEWRAGPGGNLYPDYRTTKKMETVFKTRYLNISLTPTGEQEAEGWGETEEAYGGRPDVRFWRVPVGEAEFVRLGQVIDGPGEGGRRQLSAEVVWRWRPNWLGQTFDAGGGVIGLLPEKAREAAERIGLDSQAELKAWAKLEPTEDGGWQVLSVEPMSWFMTGDYMTVE